MDYLQNITFNIIIQSNFIYERTIFENLLFHTCGIDQVNTSGRLVYIPGQYFRQAFIYTRSILQVGLYIYQINTSGRLVYISDQYFRQACIYIRSILQVGLYIYQINTSGRLVYISDQYFRQACIYTRSFNNIKTKWGIKLFAFSSQF